MRYQGKITQWNDERGFGFITQNSTTNKVFVHISGFAGRKRPSVNQLVTYECILDGQRGYRAIDVQYVGMASRSGNTSYSSNTNRTIKKLLNMLIVIILLVSGMSYSWQHFARNSNSTGIKSIFGGTIPASASMQPENTLTLVMESTKPVLEPVQLAKSSEPLSMTARKASAKAETFQCTGKQYCSQMTSCEEATFYLRNCPNTQMDGDGDGVPCESQWCH